MGLPNCHPVGGLDVHRKQITFDYVEIETGEVHRGEIRPATSERMRSWLCRFLLKDARSEPRQIA
jgi:hypothetical protein